MSNKAPQFNSLKEFYPYYLMEHSLLSTRITHFIGTSLLFILVVLAFLWQKWILFAFLPLAGYGFAWFGHFFFEKNKPATFQYPLYSLASDFIMYWHILTFQINKEMKKAEKLFPK
ncbi:MAG: Mpo1-like protein [Chitinophagales bacterium]